MIPKSTSYAVVMDDVILTKCSKREAVRMVKEIKTNQEGDAYVMLTEKPTGTKVKERSFKQTKTKGSRVMATATKAKKNKKPSISGDKIGRNVFTSVDGNTLTIQVDLSQEGILSGSGKSLVIASTQGNKEIEGTDEIFLGLNLYTKV